MGGRVDLEEVRRRMTYGRLCACNSPELFAELACCCVPRAIDEKDDRSYDHGKAAEGLWFDE